MKLYVYSSETNALMGVITGETNAECEAKAEDVYGSNETEWSYRPKRPVGRPRGSVIQPADVKKPRTIRLDDARWDKYKHLSAGWLESKIDAEPPPDQTK